MTESRGNLYQRLWPLPGVISFKALRGLLLHLFLIACAGYAAYSHTFDAPFIWDDKNFIEKNPVVRNFNYFKNPSTVENPEFNTGLKSRYVGYLTFAFNYKIHGFDVRGFHILNIAVHIVNALLVYLLVRLTFMTEFLINSPMKRHSGHLALLSGVVFVAHPVQTEAVTYIFQRFASLMTFFYLLSFVTYVLAGLSRYKSWRYVFFAVSLAAAVLAMKTKENAVTLPVVVVLYEFLFFRSCKGLDDPSGGGYWLRLKRLLMPFPYRLIPFLLTMAVLPFSLLGAGDDSGDLLDRVDSATRGYTNMSRMDYLITQTRALSTYIRLLFLPVNQTLDYDYPVFNSFFAPEVFMSFLFILSIFILAMYLLHRSSSREALLRLVSFGVIWFFTALAVESTVIPLPTLVNEYRLYLPSTGAFLAVLSGMFIVLGRFKNRRIVNSVMIATMIVPALVLFYATYERNKTFRSMVSIWEDTVNKSPWNPRAHYNLAVAHQMEGKYDSAIKHYYKSLNLNPSCEDSHFNLGVIFYNVGYIDKAIEHYITALRLKEDAETHNNLAVCYAEKGRHDLTVAHAQKAIDLDRFFTDAQFNLGLAHLNQGRMDDAYRSLVRAVEIDPNHGPARSILTMIKSGDAGLSEFIRGGIKNPLKSTGGAVVRGSERSIIDLIKTK